VIETIDRAHLAARLAVYLVADTGATKRPLLDDVGAALAGGVTAVQLRAKTVTDREALALALAIQRLCDDRSALFLLNDRLDLALLSKANGVHLGVDDIPLDSARALLGSGAIIGYSPETDIQTTTAGTLGADYLGVGPVFGTTSKSDAGTAIGLATIHRRVDLAGIPVIGIGGVTTGNAGSVISAGAVGVAVVGAVLHAHDPRRAAADLRSAVEIALAPNASSP
jgi:thiamine-phosphate pyrophosphorylase